VLLVMDVGNTRAKWAKVDADGVLQEMQSCLTGEISNSMLKRALKGVKKVLVANVAGDAVAQQLTALLPQSTHLVFLTAQPKACGVVNRYKSNSLGADRWAALIAAWHMHKQPTIVVNAGTAITIDALTRDVANKGGVYIGGTIMPGLLMMQDALKENAALLKSTHEGIESTFPTNTQDAIQTGCLNAIVGAIMLMMQHLEKHSAFLPKLVVSGGDANRIAETLKNSLIIKLGLKRVIIAENLVLQGLILIEKENV
jgi:type III pantothenate kinase